MIAEKFKVGILNSDEQCLKCDFDKTEIQYVQIALTERIVLQRNNSELKNCEI